jgi:hypothetical protein
MHLSYSGVRFADLNGDGRAEYLWIDTNGAMTGILFIRHRKMLLTGSSAYLNFVATDGGAHVGRLPQGIVATRPVMELRGTT